MKMESQYFDDISQHESKLTELESNYLVRYDKQYMTIPKINAMEAKPPMFLVQ
jgi:hypothetical protein